MDTDDHAHAPSNDAHTAEHAIETFARAIAALCQAMACVPEWTCTRPARWTAHLRRTEHDTRPMTDTMFQHLEAPQWTRLQARPHSAHKALAAQQTALEQRAHQTAWMDHEARVARRLAPAALDAAAGLLHTIAVHRPQMDIAFFVQPPYALVQIGPCIDKGRPLTTQSLRLPHERAAFERLCALFLEKPTISATTWKIDAVFHHLPHLTRPTFQERRFEGVVPAKDAAHIRDACAVLGANAALLPARLESFAFWKAPDVDDLARYDARAHADMTGRDVPR